MSETARMARDQRHHWAVPGSSHDRVVRIALVLLPAGIGVLGAFLLISPLVMGGDVSFLLDPHKVDVAAERMRIQAATYRGTDTKGRPFQLNAGSAIQKSSADPVVQLKTLAADLQLQDGPARIRANQGRYNMNTDRVALDGPIAVTSANGYTMNTHDAELDLKTKQLASGGAVTGTTPLGTFSGNRMHADLNAQTVRLDGNARLRIVPKQAKRRP